MRSPWSVVAAVGLIAATAQAQDPAQEWKLPESGLLYGSKAVVENQPCCGASRNTKVHSPDNAALAKWSGMASRDGRTLTQKSAAHLVQRYLRRSQE